MGWIFGSLSGNNLPRRCACAILFPPYPSCCNPLRFASGPGFANDWITGWSDPKGRVVFPVEVATAGRYEVGLLPAAEAPEIPLRHRDAGGRTHPDQRCGARDRFMKRGARWEHHRP